MARSANGQATRLSLGKRWVQFPHALLFGMHYKVRQYRQRRARLIALRGGKCVDCGATEDLEFDHRDPREKSFDLSRRIGSKSMLELAAEATKCDLRCHRCHVKKSLTNGDGGLGYRKHGTISMYAGGCRCSECRDAQSVYNREYIRRVGRKCRIRPRKLNGELLPVKE